MEGLKSWEKALPACLESIFARELFMDSHNLPRTLLEVRGEVFRNLLTDLLIFFVQKELQTEVQSHLVDIIGSNTLAERQWIMLKEFLAGEIGSNSAFKKSIEALLSLLRAWSVRYGGIEFGRDDPETRRWISDLMFQLGHAHFSYGNISRIHRFLRHGIRLHPESLTQEKCLSLILKQITGKRFYDFLRSLKSSIFTKGHPNFETVIHSLAGRSH